MAVEAYVVAGWRRWLAAEPTITKGSSPIKRAARRPRCRGNPSANDALISWRILTSEFRVLAKGQGEITDTRDRQARAETTMTDKLIDRNPDILGGTPVFTGTRVPVRILMEHLEAGDRLDEFLDDYPTVSRGQAIELLDRAPMILVGDADEGAA